MTIYLPVHHYPQYIYYTNMDFQHFTFINSPKIKNGTFCIGCPKQYNITSACLLWMEYAGKVYIHYQKASATGLHALHALHLCFLDTKVLRTYTFMTIYLPVHHYPHYIRYKYGLPAFNLYNVFQNH